MCAHMCMQAWTHTHIFCLIVHIKKYFVFKVHTKVHTKARTYSSLNSNNSGVSECPFSNEQTLVHTAALIVTAAGSQSARSLMNPRCTHFMLKFKTTTSRDACGLITRAARQGWSSTTWRRCTRSVQSCSCLPAAPFCRPLTLNASASSLTR